MKLVKKPEACSDFGDSEIKGKKCLMTQFPPFPQVANH